LRIPWNAPRRAQSGMQTELYILALMHSSLHLLEMRWRGSAGAGSLLVETGLSDLFVMVQPHVQFLWN